MASTPGSGPDPQQPIERIPFGTIEAAYDRWVMDKWVAATIAIFLAGLVIFLVLAFSSDDVDFDIPQVLYAVGTLLVSAGISVLLLGALSQEARATIRDMALYGKGEDVPPSTPPPGPSFTTPASPVAPGAIAFSQIMDAAKNLPTPRFLIIFGILAMLLGAGLDGRWSLPSISFDMGSEVATPAVGDGGEDPGDDGPGAG